EHGDKPIALMQPRHVRKLRDELQATPAAANMRLKALRAVFSWALENEEAPNDPTAGVKPIKHVTNGFHSWSLDEIEKYEQQHPMGGRARLAMALLLYTACRPRMPSASGPSTSELGACAIAKPRTSIAIQSI